MGKRKKKKGWLSTCSPFCLCSYAFDVLLGCFGSFLNHHFNPQLQLHEGWQGILEQCAEPMVPLHGYHDCVSFL